MGDAVRVLAVAQAPALGGAELALVRLARLLPPRGIEITAAVPGPGPLEAALRDDGVATATIPLGGLERGRWLGAIGGWPRARAAMRRLRPDLVWLNGVVTLRAAPALRGVPLVPYLHDLLENTPRPWRRAGFWDRTPVVLCASEAVAEHARRAGAPADRLRVVWAPVERPAPAARPAWAGDGQVVGFVGRIEPRKGVLDLVRAMHLVPEPKLVLVGEPELGAPAGYAREVREEAAALGDRVVLAGRVDDAPALMEWFDVLAVPSVREPFGTVAAEALAAGTPVVATRSGGMEEYVKPGRNGELVEPGDTEGLARALQAVLARARPEPANPFTPDSVADAVAAAFREALAAASRDRSPNAPARPR